MIIDAARYTKSAVRGRSLVPDVTVICQPLLTTMPYCLNAAAVFDALTRGINALVPVSRNQLIDQLTLPAVQIVADYRVSPTEQPRAIQARILMAQDALEAKMAFSNAIFGASQVVSHQEGDLPNALSLSIARPGTPAEGARALAERIKQLAACVGVARSCTTRGRDNDFPLPPTRSRTPA